MKINYLGFIAVSMPPWQCSVVISVFALINIVNRHWAWLVLGWVTICRRVNHLGM